MKRENKQKEIIWRKNMENVFLDTNIFIDIAESRDVNVTKGLSGMPLHISSFSPLVLCYSYKYTVPNKDLKDLLGGFNIIDVTVDLLEKSLHGPTSDIEDNLQLHSAAAADCDVFLTKDQELLRMAYFGKVKITDSVDQ